MRIKALAPVIIIGFIAALTYHFIALAAIDAPHNDANSVSCGSCHGQGLLNSPFWGGSMSIDQLCLNCHTASSGPYTDTNAPLVQTHSSDNTSPQYGDWVKECVNCHDPHYQKQKNFKNTNASELYLASGTIISYVYNGDGTSTLTYETITYKPGWDAEKVTKKTDKYRRTILFPNVGKLGFSYPVIGIDEDTKGITVKGDVTPVYQYITTSNFAIMYGQYVKDTIDGKPVRFFDQEGTNSFSDGIGALTGVCEVCHKVTEHFQTDGVAPDQDHVNLGSGVPGLNCRGCHTHSGGFKDSDACVDCHSIRIRERAAITPQFTGNSHHVQDVGIGNVHCYECHWEANADGSINNTYHEGYKTSTETGVANEKVDLVIYGGGVRPTSYTVGATAIQYMANGSRAEFRKLNKHCISCHSDQNDTTVPFGDGKTPKEYAWDGKSIDARYSQTGTTPWGKYDPDEYPYKPNVTPKHELEKAYSAHGNAEQNEGGWDLSEGWPNTRDGRENLLCYDCHNSHGSGVKGPTTSYVTATENGGILKDVEAGRGGYGVTYKPGQGGSVGTNNAYNAGAGLCFDCHLNEIASITPWGYKSTFGAEEQIAGYWDTPYFGPGTFASQQRYAFKVTPHQGGHFGRSSDLDPAYPPREEIGGLCTPCHDPHGVSPTLGANMKYSVPLLKGTWLTSMYQEDISPIDEREGNIRTDKGRDGVFYNIDQNTFSWSIRDTVSGITETESEFGGLCLRCHPKEDLLTGSVTWKSKRKLHQAVKGWGGYGKHKYPCSKCHTVHNSRLPRLMVTNCLDSRHKGFMGNNPSPIVDGGGSGVRGAGNRAECSAGISTELGYCPSGRYRPYRYIGGTDRRPRGGIGGGHIPGSWHGGPHGYY